MWLKLDSGYRKLVKKNFKTKFEIDSHSLSQKQFVTYITFMLSIFYVSLEKIKNFPSLLLKKLLKGAKISPY